MKTLLRSLIAVPLCFGSFVLCAEEPQMRPLFDGETLDGWKGEGYVVEDGAIACTPEGRNLITEGTFSDYILEFEFKLTPGANNGLGIHYPGEGDGAYTGMEIQVLDNTAEKYKDLKDYQFHGGIYTLAAAKKGFLKPVGEWNYERVTVNGDTVKVELNGELILDANLTELAKKHPEHVGVKRRAGHIGWLGHGDKVFYRAIKIAEIAPTVDEAKLEAEGFQPIFNGENLDGWKHEPEPENWFASNGILKHTGEPGPTRHLWTEDSYKDFTVMLDWRWSGRGETKAQPVILPDGSFKERVEIEELDSGVLLRGAEKSQVNLWNWTVGSGEVYGYRIDKNMPPEVQAAVTPKTKADKPLGEWNHMLITMKGEVLSVELNGETVIENAKLPGVPEEGPIGLQHHGQAIDFANLWIKEL